MKAIATLLSILGLLACRQPAAEKHPCEIAVLVCESEALTNPTSTAETCLDAKYLCRESLTRDIDIISERATKEAQMKKHQAPAN